MKKSFDMEPNKRPLDEQAPRTLQTLQTDHQRFVDAGSRLSQAKLLNNAVRPLILAIEIVDAVIPALHLDLVIFAWLFDHMEKELQQLDLQVAVQCSPSDEDDDRFTWLTAMHQELVAVHSKLQDAEQEYTTTQNQLQFFAFWREQHDTGEDAWNQAAQLLQEALRIISRQVDLLRRNEQDLVRQIEDVSGKGLLGPYQKSLEPVLQANKIQQQVYHGGAFIGNHVHAAMKPTVVNALTQAPVTVVEERCPNLLPEAHTIAGRYRQLIPAYAASSAIFSKSSSVSPEELSSLLVLIEDFLALCRKEIVERQLGHITPKLHLLEQHTLPLMTKLRVRIGLLGEHGAESIHSTFNNYESDLKNIPLTSQRLKTIADQHLLSCVTDEGFTAVTQFQVRDFLTELIILLLVPFLKILTFWHFHVSLLMAAEISNFKQNTTILLYYG